MKNPADYHSDTLGPKTRVEITVCDNCKMPVLFKSCRCPFEKN